MVIYGMLALFAYNVEGANEMVMDFIAGAVIGSLLMWAGYVVRTKEVFAFFAGYGMTWQPVNEARLAGRLGGLLMLLGGIALMTTVLTPVVGDVAGNASLVAVIAVVVMMVAAVVADQMGY